MILQTLEEVAQCDLKRIAVIGCPGSGKTTLAKQMGQVLMRDVVHLDKVLWKPNWQMLPYDERVKIHDDIIGGESWLIDGMWKSHLVDRFNRVTFVVFLDYRRMLCMRRAVKRRMAFAGKQRDDIADGCLEKLDNYFLHYIWSFRRNVRPLILKLIQQNPQVQVVVLKNPKQAQAFLSRLEKYQKTQS